MQAITSVFALVAAAKRFNAERAEQVRKAIEARGDLEIVKHPDPILRCKCVEVTEFDASLRELAEAMLRTIGPVYDLQHTGTYPREIRRRIGVGLGAPQVGQAIRMIVVAVPGFPEMAMVNPVITRGKGWEKDEEGCLSLPGENGDVYRYTTIWVDYQNLDGEPQHLKAKDFFARVIQHETDHLDGIEFTDRIAEQQQ